MLFLEIFDNQKESLVCVTRTYDAAERSMVLKSANKRLVSPGLGALVSGKVSCRDRESVM